LTFLALALALALLLRGSRFVHGTNCMTLDRPLP
jgi:hypothetical protein